jgi:hypothetical protein
MGRGMNRSCSLACELSTARSTTDTVRRIEDLPCLKCTDPRGADLRHALAQAGGVIDDENQISPSSRLPLGCCRIRSMPISLQQ